MKDIYLLVGLLMIAHAIDTTLNYTIVGIVIMVMGLYVGYREDKDMNDFTKYMDDFIKHTARDDNGKK